MKKELKERIFTILNQDEKNSLFLKEGIYFENLQTVQKILSILTNSELEELVQEIDSERNNFWHPALCNRNEMICFILKQYPEDIWFSDISGDYIKLCNKQLNFDSIQNFLVTLSKRQLMQMILNEDDTINDDTVFDWGIFNELSRGYLGFLLYKKYINWKNSWIYSTLYKNV